ncbi:uncharacterized protein FA14DRAFT_159977, partial [Meira miltonrushii]
MPKRLAEPIPQVQKLMESVMNASDDELPNILDGIVEWCWPRGDLHFWVPALNRFDTILEETCRDYDLSNLQINEFTPLRKRLIISVLHFSRLLIENSTSRKLYNSYEHLRNLLFARDIDVLEATLRLFLRFAQQHSGQHPRAELLPSQERLATMAVTWAPREHGMDSVDFVKDSIQVPPSFSHVRFQFYRRSNGESTSKADPWSAMQDASNVEATPTTTPVRPRPRDRLSSASTSVTSGLHAAPSTSHSSANVTNEPSASTEEGLTTIDLGDVQASGKDAMDILADAIETHHIPQEDQFELFQKLRFATSLSTTEQRRQLLTCRLLAIACYAHITSENTASTQLFLYEPDIVSRLAALVKPEHDLPQSIVAGALYALDALGRYRSKLNEVLSSLSASVNHGVLMQVLRAVIDDLATGQPSRCDQLIDAFYGLVSFVTSTSVGSGLVVGAGLVQLLVQLIDRAKPETYIVQRSMTRALGLLDSVIYAYLPAFNLFCQAQGLEVFVRRIEEEVERGIQANADEMQEEEAETPPKNSLESLYGKIPFGRAHLLRAFLQSISHMMVSTGTAEGLRNLVDTSMLASIKSIMAHRKIFGPQNLALSINIMATFVHNEPTSLGIIQEKKLPEAFLALIKDDIEPHFDVINAVPNAVGALCLNQAGLDMFGAEPIIPKLLSLLTSERHIKVLSDQDNVTVFGASIDELTRHQPTMLQAVIEGLVEVLKQIQKAGSEFEAPPVEDVSAYHLSKAEQSSLEQLHSTKAERVIAFGDILADDSEVKKNEAVKDVNIVGQYVDVTARFLEIFFQSANHCKDFIKVDGLVHLLNFYDLPCISYNFGASTAADSIVHLIRYIAEISPTVVIQGLLGEVKKSIDETKNIWAHSQNESNLIKLIAPLSDEDLQKYDSQFRQLIKMNARIQLLSDVAPTLTYAGSKTPAPFLQVINGTNSSGNGESNTSASTIADLSHFHRDWVWESILFRASAPARSPPPSDKDKSTEQDRANAVSQASSLPIIMEVEGSEGDNVPSKEEGLRTIENMQNRTLDKSDPIMKNAAALRYIVSAVKMSLSAFFSETGRLLSSRRSHDHTHKRLAMLTASQIGKGVREFLVWKECDQAVLSCAYSTSAMQQALKLLYDERPSNIGNAQTFVLIPFLREGGLDQLIANWNHLLNELQSHFEADGKPKPNSDLNDAVQLGYICSAIRACLDLFLKLVSSKALLESPATQTMTSKEGVKRSSSDFFDPYETLINLRATILPVVLEVWNKAWLEHAPSGISSTVLQILLRILEADGETKPPKRETSSQTHHPLGATGVLAGSSASAGAIGLPAALAGLTGGLGSIRSRGSALVPDENRIRQLMDMGFPRRAARHALVRCANNLSAAAEYLLMHPEVVTSMMDDDAPEQPTGARQEDASDSTAAPPTTAQEGEGSSNTAEAASESQAAPATGDATAEPENRDNTADEVSASDSIVDMLSQALPIAPADEVNPAQQNDVEMGTSTNADAEGQVEESVQKDDAGASENSEAELEELKRMTERLNESRSEIRKTLVQRALQLAERHGSLVFDVKTAVHLVSNSFANSELLVSLFDDVEQKSKTDTNGEGEKSISVRLHLLALIFHDTTVTIKLSPEKAKRFMGSLVTLVNSYLGRMQENSSRPIWFASLLLVLTSVLRAEYEIETVKIEEKEAAADAGTIRVTPSTLFDDDLPQLLSFCLAQFEHLNSLTRDDWLAVYRFLVILTRRRSIAAQFSQRDELQKLMKPFAILEPDQIAGCRALSVIILRNVLESDVHILRSTMKQDVLVWLSHQRTKTVDTTALSRALSYAMLRDPNIFIEILVESVHLVDYSVAKGQGFVKAIEAPKDRNNTQDSQPFTSPLDRDTDEQMDETQESPTKPSKSAAQANNADENESGKGKAAGAAGGAETSSVSDTVMQFLLAQLIRFSREIITKKPQTSTISGKQPQGDQMEVDSATKKDEKTRVEGNEREKQVFYTAFLLQTLTELLSSYIVCKTSFLHSTKRKALHTAVSSTNAFNTSSTALKKDSTPLKTKNQGSILHFFLTELIPSGFLSSREYEDMRRVMTISNWSMSVIVALCADIGSTISKDNHGEVGQTRRNVLDALAKAMKESTSSSAPVPAAKTLEPVETRYGRLYSMADLTYRLLKAQPNANPSSLASARPWDDSMLHLAKTMLERNFVTTLTSALADVDLNLPMVKPLLDRILKPLEYLTKVAIKMNRAERKGEKQRGTLIDSDESGTFTSDDSIEDDDMDEDDDEDEEEDHHDHEENREETPDFYRNSSLGMHTGDLEGGYQGIDEDEEEDEDEDEDMDDDMHHPMGFDDEHTDDSDDSDDDIEERIVEVMEEDDEDADMTDSDSDDDDDEEGDEDEDGDEDGWIDEDDEDDIIDLDDSEDEGDEDNEALDFVIDGDGDQANALFEQAGQFFHAHDHDDLGPDGLPAPIMVEGEDDDEDEEEEEAMEEDEEGSVLEEVFEDGLQPLGLLDPMETFNAAPVDRFGANWGWTNVPNPASASARGSGNGGDAAEPHQGAAPTTVNPLAFIRQRATSSRHSRSRRLLDWDSDPLGHPVPPIGGRVYGYPGTGRRPLMGEGLGGNDQDIVSHPLLHQDPQSDASRSGNPTSRLHRSLATRRDHAHRRGGERDQGWAQSLEEMMEGGAMQFLETILSRSGAAGMLGNSDEPIRISLTSQGGMSRMSIGGQTITRGFDANFGNIPSRRSNDQEGDSSDRSSSNRPIDIVALIQEFTPAQTSTRWTDASRIVHGPQAHERSSSLRPYMINALRSGYLRDQEDLKRREAELEEEKRKNKADLEEAKQAKERVEKELNEARAQFEELRRGNQNESEQRESAAQNEVPAQTSTESQNTANDVEMSDDTVQQNAETSTAESTLPTPANLELGSLQQGLDELDTSASAQADRTTAGEGTSNESEQAETQPQSAAAEPNEPQAQPAQRVTTTVNGSEIDITDSGIDPTFLEALPEEMREEVLNQHFRERRVAAAAAAAAGDGNTSSTDPSANADSTSIAPEFLDALPPEIRAEVIQQEAQERARRRLEESRRESRRTGGEGNNAGSGGPSEIDPVSFLATLGPDLRNAVLLDQDQSFLDSLPASMLPEGDEARRTQRRHVDMRRLHRRFDATGMPIAAGDQSGPSGQTNGAGRENENRGADAQNADSTANKANQPGSRDAIQLLDKSGIAALVRLMFFPQMDAQQSGLRHVMINLAENAKTRHELLNLLLLMLADSCSTETNAVDRSYVHMSGRMNSNKQPVQTPTRPNARRVNSTPGTAAHASGSGTASNPSAQNPAFIAPISRTGDEAPFLIASRSIEMLLHLAGANERAAYYFLRDDPNNHSLMKWFKRNTSVNHAQTPKGKEKGQAVQSSNAPINILLILLGKPSILANSQLVDNLIALLHTVTKPLPTIASNVKKAQEAADAKQSSDKPLTADTTSAATANTGASNGESTDQAKQKVNAQGEESSNSTSLPESMPQIAADRMSAVVKPLSTSISSKGFQNTLAVASNLATIDGARDLITNALQEEAKMASKNLLSELDLLLESLPPAPVQDSNEDEHDESRRMSQSNPGEQAPIVQQTQQRQAAPTVHINSPALTQLASPSSSQTVILRSLRALEWVISHPKNATNGSGSNNAHPSGSNRPHSHHHPIGGTTTIRL